MPTYANKGRVTNGQFDAGYNAEVRVIDFVVNMAAIDGVSTIMTTATDDIQLATLPAGAQVVAVTLQQVAVGTGTGTLVARVGTTAVTATLASTAAVGTVPATVPAALPLVVPVGGAELNLLGATAVRVDGVVRVAVSYVEGDRAPRIPVVAPRDATL